MKANMTVGPWRDSIGMIASIGCAIHCAAMPFVIAYLPMLGLKFLADEAFHRWMAVACFAIAVAAFIPGYRTHSRLLPGAVACIGLIMLFGAAFGFAGECCTACQTDMTATNNVVTCGEACCEFCAAEALEPRSKPADQLAGSLAYPMAAIPFTLIGPWVTPIGGLILVTAHLLNRRYGCQCGCCPSESVTETT